MAQDPDEAEALRRFEESLELVDKLARQIGRVVGPSVELDELLSFGREGLLDAARRFDASRGVPFRAYANYRVRGAIYDGVRQISRLPRRTYERLNGLAAAAAVSEGALEDVSAPPVPGAGAAVADAALSEHLASFATAMALGFVAEPARGEGGERTSLDSALDPEEAFASAELLKLVRHAIADLPHEEAELVRRHYLEGERFDLVAAELGLSKSWASRLHTRAMGRLSKRLRAAT
ncbi:MAG TPA: sigma-70 family RNA polymerase sigma factor [Polyangiaceae bacterium]|nr:sigma-70 family RNA polymerase sigma factor [Polyangiaceae bacterium]